MSMQTITPGELHELIVSGRPIELIDVRTPVEFAQVHAASARLVPLDQLDPNTIRANCTNGEPIYVICKSGARGAKACQRLIDAGVTNVANVQGGTTAWIEAGLPVSRDASGPKVISLERQVRIAAGLLILIGASLGWLVHPVFFGLCAFVGAGLVFAGVTDFCGMGLLLARMPWNRRTTCKSR
jgi:rhodanese-related sulfurtransferase